MGMPPNVIRHSNKYVHCPPQKPYFKVATDASFSAAVQVPSVLCKSTCLNRLGGVAATLGGGRSVSLGGGGTENWGPQIMSQTKHLSEDGEAAFKRTRRDVPKIFLKIPV